MKPLSAIIFFRKMRHCIYQFKSRRSGELSFLLSVWMLTFSQSQIQMRVNIRLINQTFPCVFVSFSCFFLVPCFCTLSLLFALPVAIPSCAVFSPSMSILERHMDLTGGGDLECVHPLRKAQDSDASLPWEEWPTQSRHQILCFW